MTLFAPAEITSAYLKQGSMGFQGSGKTKTSGLLAIGLVKHLQKLNIEYANRPVFFLDTETGSDWIIPDFKEMGVDLHVAKTRSFTDLITAIDEAEKNAAFLIADSITHFWKELCDSYVREKTKKLKLKFPYRLQFQDWSYLKGEDGWQKFSDRYINSALHIGVCGRAGFEYDYFEDDDGKKQLEKTGVKMKAEGEFGFEPSLLVQMELRQEVQGKSVTKLWREAHVIKDRSTLIDGKTFIFTTDDDDGNRLTTEQMVNRTFRAFFPHINRLNLGGKQLGVDTKRTSQHAVSTEKKDWSSTQRKVVLDELQTLMVEHYPSTGKEDKQAKIKLMRDHFGDEEMTWTKIEEVLPLVDLRMGYDSMYRELKGKPSQYATLFAPEKTTTAIGDEIPGFDAPTAPAQISLKDTLLADIGQLASMADCMHFGIQLAQLTGLKDEDANVINAALIARQNTIGKITKPGDGGDEGGNSDPAEPPKGNPDGGKPDEGNPSDMPPPSQQPDRPQPTARRQTARPTENASERTMADLVATA